MSTWEDLQTVRRRLIHDREEHERTFLAHPAQVPRIIAAVDRLMAEPEFRDMPRPSVVGTEEVTPGHAYLMCARCGESIADAKKFSFLR